MAYAKFLIVMACRQDSLTALLSCQLESETDFFLNVAHLQLHRRSRTFSRLSAMASRYQPMMETNPEHPDMIIYLRCLQDVCFSLIAAVLKESLSSRSSEKKSLGHGSKEGDFGREAGVADGAIIALGSAARLLQWPQYQGLLLRFLKLMKDSQGASKPLVRAFCAVLDSFHFESPRDAIRAESIDLSPCSLPAASHTTKRQMMMMRRI